MIYWSNVSLFSEAILFCSSFALTYVLTPLMKIVSLKIGAVDNPAQGKVHSQPKPRLGGAAIFWGVFLPVFIFWIKDIDQKLIAVLFGGIITVSIGLFDDIYNLSPGVKLLGQSVAVSIPIFVGFRIALLQSDLLNALLTFLYFLAAMNALNLIDGLDGLADGVAIIASSAFFLVLVKGSVPFGTTLSLSFIGALLGFLNYNFFPAKMFMGDSGSNFLGYNLSVLATLSINGANTPSRLLGSILIMWIPIYDTVLTILRRLFHHLPLGQGDLGHFYNRIMEGKKLDQKKTVLILWGIAFPLAGVGVLVAELSTFGAIIAFTFVAILSALAALKYNFLRGNK